ncbi:MAG: cysteine desulfurase [Clostridia bacterium]|nr:cysteine desulfurase [Clostridia bacterium]
MIFLDNASTTKIYDEALKEYNEQSVNNFYNASALYKSGSDVLKQLNKARANLIKLLGGSTIDNLIFTSGATEANNMAVNGSIRKNCGKLVFSYAEHPAIFNVAKNLQNQGYNVEFVDLTKDGVVDEEDFKQKIKGASFISVMHVCNETGAVNDIKRLVRIAKTENKDVIFHSDGVQAFGKIAVNVKDLGVDLYTISAHKIHGPKGVGALYVKKGINLKPSVFGGGQEFGLRSGTENTCGILAFNVAAQKIVENQKINFSCVTKLKEEFLHELTNNFDVIINSTNACSPYIISFAVLKVKAETILHMAEEQGVLISNGSACSSKHTDNRILSAMGIDPNTIASSVRVSFSEFNTTNEVVTAAKVIKETCTRYIKILK